MSSFKQMMRHTKKHENGIYTQENDQVTETACESIQLSDLIDKDFKTAL